MGTCMVAPSNDVQKKSERIQNMTKLAPLLLGLSVCSFCGLLSAEESLGNVQLENDSSRKKTSSGPDEVVWEEIAKAVLCGTDGTDNDQAKAVKNVLKAYDSTSNWLVMVTPLGASSAWSWEDGWTILDERDLCGKNLLVFKRASDDMDCMYNIKDDIMELIHKASTEGQDVTTVRNVILNREHMYNLNHRIIFTYSGGSWSTWDYASCHNYDQSGNVGVFYYGFSTNQRDGMELVNSEEDLRDQTLN